MADHLQAATNYEGHRGAIYSLCALDERSFLSAGGEGIVVRWRTDEPDHGDAVIDVGEPVYSLGYDQAQGTVLVGTGSGRLLGVDLGTRKVVQAGQHGKGIFRIFQHGERALVCAGGDGVLSTWYRSDEDGQVHRRQRSIPLCAEKLRDIALLQGDVLAIACGDGSIRLLRTADFNEVARAEGHVGGVTCVNQHPSKPALLSGGKDGMLKAWRLDGGPVHSVAAHKGTIYSVMSDPSGRYLLTSGRDALLKVWSADALDPVSRSARDRSGHTHSINAMIMCGDLVLTGSDDRRIRGWRITP